ncbi:hypothetical protein E2C01_009375 [Portunus trituberculatus]|uniref:Uncharacterized protein n=1 Tax=Portunus trituberculatus TaxID=210409 RepID=A0A5B7D5I2_PORTR|nr:hypothetical protein [Portunus trituberculatus]
MLLSSLPRRLEDLSESLKRLNKPFDVHCLVATRLCAAQNYPRDSLPVGAQQLVATLQFAAACCPEDIKSSLMNSITVAGQVLMDFERWFSVSLSFLHHDWVLIGHLGAHMALAGTDNATAALRTDASLLSTAALTQPVGTRHGPLVACSGQQRQCWVSQCRKAQHRETGRSMYSKVLHLHMLHFSSEMSSV